MSDIGISSACYYPLLTEKAFRRVCETGAKTAEIFFNAESELKPDFLAELNRIRDFYGVKIASIHPFSSFMESNHLFSLYERRFWDTLELYRRFFEAAQTLGAPVFVVHGIKKISKSPDELYFERYRILLDEAKKSGVTFAQENVVLHRGESPDYLLKMKDALGEDFRVVFDLKQARRAQVDIFPALQKLAGLVCHIHVSDGSQARDCLPPGEGSFDFARLFRVMAACAYRGDYIIELYSDGYASEKQITDSLAFLKEKQTAALADCSFNEKQKN